MIPHAPSVRGGIAFILNGVFVNDKHDTDQLRAAAPSHRRRESHSQEK
jgi:hypothetical protein